MVVATCYWLSIESFTRTKVMVVATCYWLSIESFTSIKVMVVATCYWLSIESFTRTKVMVVATCYWLSIESFTRTTGKARTKGAAMMGFLESSVEVVVELIFMEADTWMGFDTLTLWLVDHADKFNEPL